MKFGQVKGTAICTIKYEGLEGLKLLNCAAVGQETAARRGAGGGG